MIKFKLLLSVGLFLFMSCGEDKVIFFEGEVELDGKWKLIEFCQSPGDASCPKQTPDFNQSYEFDGNSFSYESRDVRCGGTFTVTELELSTISFKNIGGDESSCFDQGFYLWIIDEDHININPFCIEECTYLYERQ